MPTAIQHDTENLIYVIDDDDSIRKSLKRLLNSVGYAVETFASGEAFMQRKETRKGDCLILDVHLPVVNGLDLQKRLVENGSVLPIIFITAHDDSQICACALKAGAREFFLKPFNEDLLLKTIQETIEETSH